MRLKPFKPTACPLTLFARTLALLAIVALHPRASADSFGLQSVPHLPEYDTKYYRVYTDVDPQEVKEACIRMTKMAEEYHKRTSDFAGQITEQLPFYLFKSSDEYYAAGGLPNSAGVFNGTRLMAIGDKRFGRQIWHIVQHEGFHQFVHAVIGGAIPIWVNEGMAEYFGEAIFTGDGFISGVIPTGRLDRVRKTMELPPDGKGFKSLRTMMDLSHAEWNKQLSLQNYDQAWSMVQFLAHGDGGKYQSAFSRYMTMVGAGQDPRQAWTQNFGDDDLAFETRWRAYWQSLPTNPTGDLYAQASVATLTSYLARAIDQRQKFPNFDAFEKAAEAGTLKSAPDEWLPPSLLESTLRDLAVRKEKGERFSFSAGMDSRLPTLNLNTEQGLHVIGKFTLRDEHVDDVTVTIAGKHS